MSQPRQRPKFGGEEDVNDGAESMSFYIIQHFKVKCYYLGLVPKQRLINFNNCSVAAQQYRRGEECSAANLAEPLIDVNGTTFCDVHIQSCSDDWELWQPEVQEE